jgi:hypothetical protein
VGNQVIEANLVSGNPVTISPTTSTTYTLAVTNLAGASVTRDLAIAVN